MINAKIIADSKNAFGNRLTTFVLTFPRIILAEVNTHRMLSRNSASSRAIPFEKMVKMVEENPFIPIKWMKDHKGMQGVEYFTDDDIKYGEFIEQWLSARDNAIESAKSLSEGITYSDGIDSGDAPSKEGNIGVTKQIVNRLLEPFMWHTAIVTATEWENFFALRAHDAAEIHLQDLAYKMLEEYNKSTPKELKAGEWHIPFGDKFEEDRLGKLMIELDKQEQVSKNSYHHILKWEELVKVKIASARCARISYSNFEGKDDYEADIKLHDNLIKMGHWSALEHCARAMNHRENNGESFGSWSGNFRGFVQYRKLFEQENKSDNRVAQVSV